MARCYSMRMLNPFHGMVNVVEIDNADAVSRDGLNWSLYIQSPPDEEEGEDGGTRIIEVPDIKFADWSVRGGLKRAPVRLVNDYSMIDHIGSQLLAAVKAHIERLPFVQCDRYELWLLDTHSNSPLALIDSACCAAQMVEPLSLAWRPGQRARQAFRVHGDRRERPDDLTDADRLGQLINHAAGQPLRAQWFERGMDGSGRAAAGVDCPAPLSGELPATAFPELLIRRDWAAAQDSQLVEAFLHWQAPLLLQLQHLGDSDRQWLESAACQRPFEIAEQYRLYPRLMNRARITAARVEARLREAGAAPVDTPPGDEFIPPFYIEE